MLNPLITAQTARPDHLEMYPLSIEHFTSYIEEALDPALVLQRGYALGCEKNGSIVRNGDSLVVGDELSIQFGAGQAKVRVIENGEK
jgi:exonuclease VII large subunit